MTLTVSKKLRAPEGLAEMTTTDLVNLRKLYREMFGGARPTGAEGDAVDAVEKELSERQRARRPATISWENMLGNAIASKKWLILAGVVLVMGLFMNMWAFASITVIVLGAVAGFAIYTFGRRDPDGAS